MFRSWNWTVVVAWLRVASAATFQSLNTQYGGATSDSGTYLYGANKWGDDGSGSQNMTVLLADTNGASFNATWIWENNIEYVHSYPNIGYESIQLPTQLSNINTFQLSGITYQLFSGYNQQVQKQAVYSWVPTVYQSSVDANVFELINELVNLGNITSDMYLGLIQFGSETVHATEEVELQMKDVQMSIGVVSSRTKALTSTSTSKGWAATVAPRITNFAIPAAVGVGVMMWP